VRSFEIQFCLLLFASFQIFLMELVIKSRMLSFAELSAKVILLSSSLFSNSSYGRFFLEITASNICRDVMAQKYFRC